MSCGGGATRLEMGSFGNFMVSGAGVFSPSRRRCRLPRPLFGILLLLAPIHPKSKVADFLVQIFHDFISPIETRLGVYEYATVADCAPFQTYSRPAREILDFTRPRFGLRWQAQRDTAFRTSINHRTRLVIPKAPSPLRSAGAFQIKSSLLDRGFPTRKARQFQTTTVLPTVWRLESRPNPALHGKPGHYPFNPKSFLSDFIFGRRYTGKSMSGDLDLLRQYARDNSQDAFTALVNRHVHLVYSAALRQVGLSQLAEEVAQSVFADLAHHAGSLARSGDAPLPGSLTPWLYTVTRRTAIDAVRKESRRRLREQIAVEMDQMNATANGWTQIAPLLDDAMTALEETDRAAILLRYFENKSLREVGEALGASEDAAQKRVSRAVEKLREFFSKRNVTVGTAGLTVLISANAVQSAPVGLAVAISTAALAGTAVSTSTVIAATKTIAMTTIQKAIIGTTLAVVAGAGAFEAHQAAQLREQNQTLQQQQAAQLQQFQQLQREHDDATNRLAALLAENSPLKSNSNETELLKLRGEVTRLRAEANEPTVNAAIAVASKIKLLKQYLEHSPDKGIPELQFVADKDWADAAWNSDLKTDDDYRETLSKVRQTAEDIFLNEMMKAAFKKYLAANNDVLPNDLSELKPYFDVPVTDEMLQRYKLLQTGKPDNSADLVTLIKYADDEYDSNHGMSINGAWGGRFNTVSGAVQTAAAAFAKDNNGQAPTQSSQIMSYLAQPIDAQTVQKYLNQLAGNSIANGGPMSHPPR